MKKSELFGILRECGCEVREPANHITGKYICIIRLSIAQNVDITHDLSFYQPDPEVSRNQIEQIRHKFGRYNPVVKQLLS